MRHRTVRDARYRYIKNFTPEAPFFSPNAYKAKQYPVWNHMQQLHAEAKLNAVQEVLCQPGYPPRNSATSKLTPTKSTTSPPRKNPNTRPR